MKPLSQQLAELSQRARSAEDAAATASSQARQRREELRGRVEQARATAQQQAGQLRQATGQAADEATAWWTDVQDTWNSHLRMARTRISDTKGRLDADLAQRRASNAEAYATAALAFALATVDEAEYAVLDAILARADADDLTAQPARA
jgi:hypothetical protein